MTIFLRLSTERNTPLNRRRSFFYTFTIRQILNWRESPMSTPAMPVPTPSAESSSALSEGERLINVFVAPSKTFTDLKRKASWFVPWLLLAVVSYAFIGAVAQKVGLRQDTENQMRLNTKAQERMAQMPAEQRERAMEISVMVTKVILFFVPLIALLFYLIIAAVLMGSFNFGMGAEIP